MGESYNPDEARAALDEAKRYASDNPDTAAAAESWAYAAELFERGATQDAYAASQSILCYRKAGRTADALRVGTPAVSEFPHDNWVRGHLAWAEYDRAKAAGDNVDEALDALGRMIDLASALDDPAMHAEQAYWRLWRLMPKPPRDGFNDPDEPADPTVVDFLASRFEVLFRAAPAIARSRDGQVRTSPKELLAQMACRHFLAAARWDDLTFAMSLATEAFPEVTEFSTARITALLELGKAGDAVQAGEDALRDKPDAKLVRLVARAQCVQHRYNEAAATLLAGCYQFRDVWLWRDLAGVRWTSGDIEGANRALAIALRLVSRERDAVRSELAPRFHQGRAAGAMRLEDFHTAALEAVAAEAAGASASLDNSNLLEVMEALGADHADLLDEARELPAAELQSTLEGIWADEREHELEIGLQAATVTHLDEAKGFGYVVASDSEGESDGDDGDGNAEGQRIYFTLKAVEGGAAGLAVGSSVRVLLARMLDRRDPQYTPMRAVIVRPG